MRVSKAGYIETPDALCEQLIPFRFHRLEVTDDDRKIRIWKKPSWRPRDELVDLFEKKVKDRHFIRLMKNHPEPFYMRYYWEDSILFEIVNPEVDISWPMPKYSEVPVGGRSKVRSAVVNAARGLFSQKRRNKEIDIFPLLKCVECDSIDLVKEQHELSCRQCGVRYPLRSGIPVMMPSA